MEIGQVFVGQSSSPLIGSSDIEVSTVASFPTPKTDSVVRHAKAAAPAEERDFHEELDSIEPPSIATGGVARNRKADAQVVSFPPRIRPDAREGTFLALQEWEGHVVSIEHDSFVAHLVDLTAEQSHESEEATVPIDELSDRDAANLTVGGIFRWVIGYERSPEGTRKRVSQIIFRDLPRMTESDLQSGREWANKIAPVLNR